MKKTNFAERFPELKLKDFDEKYALLTHAIQLEGTPEARGYIEILEENG